MQSQCCCPRHEIWPPFSSYPDGLFGEILLDVPLVELPYQDSLARLASMWTQRPWECTIVGVVCLLAPCHRRCRLPLGRCRRWCHCLSLNTLSSLMSSARLGLNYCWCRLPVSGPCHRWCLCLLGQCYCWCCLFLTLCRRCCRSPLRKLP